MRDGSTVGNSSIRVTPSSPARSPNWIEEDVLTDKRLSERFVAYAYLMLMGGGSAAAQPQILAYHVRSLGGTQHTS
jgi:hypothetical protein